jgi:hypothetical protein
LDEALRADIDAGRSAVLRAINAAVDREERNEVIQDLRGSVEYWKGHRPNEFGDLLLHGTFSILKGDPVNFKGQEREVRIEHLEASESKGTLTTSSTNYTSSSTSSSFAARRRPPSRDIRASKL